jgi:hypothetical protein
MTSGSWLRLKDSEPPFASARTLAKAKGSTSRRRQASYTARIPKVARPADAPMEAVWTLREATLIAQSYGSQTA